MPLSNLRQRDDDTASVESERYRVAAENALQQLDWAVRYLQRIREPGIAKALARNRDYIRTRIRSR